MVQICVCLSLYRNHSGGNGTSLDIGSRPCVSWIDMYASTFKKTSALNYAIVVVVVVVVVIIVIIIIIIIIVVIVKT